MKDISFFSDFILKRVEKRLDTISAVDSGSVKGTGKTVLTIGSSKDLCSKIGYKWDLEKMMMMNPTTAKIIDLIKTLPFGTPIPVDEAIFLAYKRDYNEDPVKNLVKFVNICRKFRKPVFLNTPSFWDLDRDIRSLCDFRITVIKRGIACVRGKYSNPEYEDLWLRDESMKAIDKEIGSDFTDLNAVIRGIGKCRNHLFDITFPDLPEDEYNAYEKLSMREEGKQLFLDEKKVYIIVKILCYLLLEESYYKNSLGEFTRWNSGILTRTANDYMSRSRYSQEFSKFKMQRVLFRDYKRAWKEDMGEGVVVAPVINNNNIPNRETEEEKDPADEAIPEPEKLLEEIA